ncbi:MAG: lysophospholipid acyltransferase family protein [Saprospiraceae bacterium]
MFLFRKFWAIYAVVLFLTLMTFSVPVLLFNMLVFRGPKALRNNIWYLHHVFTPTFLLLIGIRLQIEGSAHLDPNRSYIIVGNHRSSLDFIVNAAAFPGVYQYLAKQELMKIPVFGWVVRNMCLIVDRSSAMSRARSVVAIKQQLSAGWSVFIYPEGSRNATNEPLAPFFDGAFRIAIQTKAPIAVQTIVNIRDVSDSTRFGELKPGNLRIIWDKPIETADLQSTHIESLKLEVEAIMRNHLQNEA